MENGSRRKHMAKLSFCQSQQHEQKKTYMKKHRHQAAAWFIFPPSSQFQEFYEWKMSGDRFSKATMACVSWAYHAVLVSSCRLDRRCGCATGGGTGTRQPPASTLHHAVWLLTDSLTQPEGAKLKSLQSRDSNDEKKCVGWWAVLKRQYFRLMIQGSKAWKIHEWSNS